MYSSKSKRHIAVCFEGWGACSPEKIFKSVYIRALSYDDDITIMCPSIRGLNKMLKIYYNFAQSNYRIIFNNKKTVCIKFDKEIVKNDKSVLNTHVLNPIRSPPIFCHHALIILELHYYALGNIPKI